MAHQAARSAVNHGSRVLSVLEKAKLVCWLEETNSFAQVARRYRAEFGMEPPHLEQVKKWHQRFLATGSITNGHENGNGHDWVHSAGQQQQQDHSSIDTFGMEAEEQLKMAGLR